VDILDERKVRNEAVFVLNNKAIKTYGEVEVKIRKFSPQ
jgi:hypothetical protein